MTTGPKWEIWNVEDLLADTTPIPDDVIEGFIPGGAVVLLSGPGGDGKSYAMLDLAVCVSEGKQWLGMDVHQTPVLVIDMENRLVRLRERTHAVITGHQLNIVPPPLKLAFGTDFRLCRDEFAIEVSAMAAQCGAGLIILDSLVDFLGDVDENSNPEMGRVADRLRKIAEMSGASVIAIHHTPKHSGATPRGATALRNGVDVCVMISRNGLTIKLETDKNRCGPEKTVVARLNWQLDTFKLTPVSVASGRQARVADVDEQAILDALDDDQWHLSNEIVDLAMQATSHKRSTIHSKMSAMIKDGLLEKKPSGSGKPYQVRLDQDPLNAAMKPPKP